MSSEVAPRAPFQLLQVSPGRFSFPAVRPESRATSSSRRGACGREAALGDLPLSKTRGPWTRNAQGLTAATPQGWVGTVRKGQ